MSHEEGKYAMVIGPDGVGKTTLVEAICRFLKSSGIGYISIAEPGGTPFGRKLRDVLLEKTRANRAAQILAFCADKINAWVYRIRPALRRGMIVIQDRGYFANYAYEVITEKDPAKRSRLKRLNDILLELLFNLDYIGRPDAVILLIASGAGLERARKVSEKQNITDDRWESVDPKKYSKIEQGYFDQIPEIENDGTPFIVINTSNQSADDTAEEAIAFLKKTILCV